MKRVLITGMSGTGKSAVIRELVGRGHLGHDLDTADWSHWVDVNPSDELTPVRGKDWLWQEARVGALLTKPIGGTLFVSGCAQNMSNLFPLIDCIILLSAPVDTILRRLAGRSLEGYGHSDKERRKVVDLIATVEPLLREAADYEIDTSRAVAATVDEILRLV
jgi:shikimate kinase